MTVHCMFEQSGTFKNEFIKLGYNAIDYDIKNDFNETNVVIDLFTEISNAYNGISSIFDNVVEDDLIIAFFPCIRFEHQIRMGFKGVQSQIINCSEESKLEYDLKLHKELSYLYELVTKLAIVCLRKNIKLIIENPYKSTHYLTQFWALQPQVIDMDRTLRGDFFKKPTQYWFINIKPSQNMIWEPQVWNKKSNGVANSTVVERSLFSSDYANRFIREFIL